MEDKSFQVDYTVVDPGETVDVSFALTEEAEDALFTGLADIMHDKASSGTFDGEVVHLYKRLADQHSSYPPWFDIESDHRVYDLELTGSEYGILSTVVGKQVTNVLKPGAAPKYQELTETWEEITRQMTESNDTDSGEELNPDNGRFVCLLRGGNVAMFKNERIDSTWYKCLDCETMFKEIGSNHECSIYE